MDIWNNYLALVDGWKLIALLVLILVDFVAGVVVAFKEGTFSLDRLADYVSTSIIFYILGYFLAGFVALVHEEFASTLTGIYVTIDVALVAGILGKQNFGLNIPQLISRDQ